MPSVTPGFVDSHAHLADPAFQSDVAQVTARARDAGAAAIVVIGESIDAAARAAALAASEPGFLHFTAGVHPHDATTFEPARDLAAIRDFASRGAVAVGECGLDYHYDNSPRPQQLAALEAQAQLAVTLRLPIVMHTRDAVEDTIAFLGNAAGAGLRGVLHCFTGPASLAEAAIAAGWFVSFAGVITFRKWEGDDLIRLVPSDRLLVETDSPYLAPVPRRGSRNEPAYMTHTLARLASARAVSLDEATKMSHENASRFFGLAIPSTAS
ncbi:MAG: TatD family hydrolase [Gemmatimonadota bacterium]